MTSSVPVPVERSPIILVVDPCPETHQALRRQLRTMHPKWIVLSVETACRAVDILERQPVDVLITELGLPDISGARLLGLAFSLERTPTCIVHSAQERDAMGLTGLVHRVLPKPTDAVALFTAVVSALRMRREADRHREDTRSRRAS